MALPSAELPRTAGPGYLHPVAAPLEGVSARRTFGTLISAGRNRISLLRLGASGDFAVCCRAWRLPAAHKKHWSGLPTASSAARPGVGLLSAGGGHEAIPAIAHARQAISRAVAQFATGTSWRSAWAMRGFERTRNGVDWGWFPDPWRFVRCGWEPGARRLILFQELSANRKTPAETG